MLLEVGQVILLAREVRKLAQICKEEICQFEYAVTDNVLIIVSIIRKRRADQDDAHQKETKTCKFRGSLL